jgi:hypothetical protein
MTMTTLARPCGYCTGLVIPRRKPWINDFGYAGSACETQVQAARGEDQGVTPVDVGTSPHP